MKCIPEHIETHTCNFGISLVNSPTTKVPPNVAFDRTLHLLIDVVALLNRRTLSIFKNEVSNVAFMGRIPPHSFSVDFFFV